MMIRLLACTALLLVVACDRTPVKPPAMVAPATPPTVATEPWKWAGAVEPTGDADPWPALVALSDAAVKQPEGQPWTGVVDAALPAAKLVASAKRLDVAFAPYELTRTDGTPGKVQTRQVCGALFEAGVDLVKAGRHDDARIVADALLVLAYRVAHAPRTDRAIHQYNAVWGMQGDAMSVRNRMGNEQMKAWGMPTATALRQMISQQAELYMAWTEARKEQQR